MTVDVTVVSRQLTWCHILTQLLRKGTPSDADSVNFNLEHKNLKKKKTTEISPHNSYMHCTKGFKSGNGAPSPPIFLSTSPVQVAQCPAIIKIFIMFSMGPQMNDMKQKNISLRHSAK
ncbi:hypothetical protein AMECASPLE_020412 [Ameca splendens]|uniref:Uncharacterized protein n=1 Tax=Ameca splendens TaxID=208324 RepID=A0ABV0Z368_9TELE